MKHNRIARAVVAFIALVLFGVYIYLTYPLRITSADIEGFGEPTVSFIDLLRRGYVIRENPVEEASEPEQSEAEDVQVPDGEAVAEQTPEPSAEPTVDPDSPAGRAAALSLPAPPDIDINEWQYLLVNANTPLDPQDYAPEQLGYLNMTADETDIQTARNDYRCAVDSRIAQPLLDMALACKAAGQQVYLSSGYRSYADQSYLFQRKVSQGYSEDVAKTIVAYPGTSEHQTGLCCDITDYYRETKDSSLEQTETYKWLCENCADYGFVVRYPADKSGSADTITGVIYEPWHFRYVGIEAAKYMTENNLCLEEFVALYK